MSEKIKRLLIPVSACIVLAYVALMVATGGLLGVPAVIVCDRGKPNLAVYSTDTDVYFEENRIGPCVTYTHKATPVPGPGGD